MSRSVSVFMAWAAVLGLVTFSAAISANNATSMVAMQDDNDSCSRGDTGSVGVSITGKMGDSFTISLECGGVTVVKCTATVGRGSEVGHCSESATMPNNGARNCPVTPGGGNSRSAAVMATDCF